MSTLEDSAKAATDGLATSKIDKLRERMEKNEEERRHLITMLCELHDVSLTTAKASEELLNEYGGHR